MANGELFDEQFLKSTPLPNRLRPLEWDEFVGQDELTKTIRSRKLHSMILYGPPGCGKTTLARLISTTSSLDFYSLSAVSSGVKELREVIKQAESSRNMGNEAPILFIDEIHRFSKSQQDALLHAVESGILILIGATTENPGFEVIGPLLSRCRVYRLNPHSRESLLLIMEKAFQSDPALQQIELTTAAREALLGLAGGDARKMLGILETAIPKSGSGDKPVVIDTPELESIVQQNFRLYDKSGEYHYDYISAFIKSLRGSDPDAALLYLATMLEGGEDPLFIARRLVIFASEDIGNASPQALSIAVSAFMAVERIGMPESRIILSQAVTFLASSPKSNASYQAINQAQQAIAGKSYTVPLHLRNAPTRIHREAGASDGYRYPHDYPGHYVDENYLPEGFEKSHFYRPSTQGQEERIRERLQHLRPHRKYSD